MPGTLLRGGLTFLCVCVGWVFFRATTFGGAAEILRRMFVSEGWRSSALHSMGMWYTLVFVALCHAAAVTGLWKRLSVRLPAPVLGWAYSLTLTFALLLAPPTGKAFIYFQF